MFDGGFMTQQFAFGGEEGKEMFDEQILYRSSLQNFLIDTGKEVILVDTGFKTGFPVPPKKLGVPLYMGEKVADYMDSFAALGYKPEQVTKILVTHKHPDHSAALEYFPNAKIYVSPEDADAMKLEGENIVRAEYGTPYKNFPNAQQVADDIWFIEAKGHTKGNSIIVVEDGGLFYMLHGDITYCDEALYEDKLSVVFDDLPAARETLDRVREFVRDHPTVYCSTHTPQGYENLEAKRVMDLDNPVPTVFAEVDFTKQEASGKYVCSICGYVYDPAEHDGVAFEDLPDDWRCPRCKQPKEKFNKA
jgi:glyoxylase-like metal-dependent hydrolase (beta-lactamase superfamily II)